MTVAPHATVPLEFEERPPDHMTARARAFRTLMSRRRTVRDFADRTVPAGVIEDCIMTAASAPSGANQQPWHFAMIADADVKSRIRQAAEAEEREFYSSRAGPEWLGALAPLGTDAEKPFLEIAPWLIAVFGARWGVENGARIKHYYVPESVGIAVGLLIAALHNAGLATLTHTPAPMGFLNEICRRPQNEKPYVFVVAGYPAANCTVPAISRKPIAAIVTKL